MKKEMKCCGKGCDNHEKNMMMIRAKKASDRRLLVAVGIGLVLWGYSIFVLLSI